MTRFALLVVALVALAASALAADSVTAIEIRDGFYRHYTVWANPSVAALQNGTATGLAVAAYGARLEGSSTAVSVDVDVAGFKFKNPSDLSDGVDKKGLAFYFGYLGLSGAWSNTTATASLAGALAEIVSTWDRIFVWYDYNSQPGLQWNTNTDLFDCNKASTQNYDCVDLNHIIAIPDMAFGGIQHEKSDCPSGMGYADDCAVHKFTTSSLDGVLTFTLRLASEPVLINNVRVEPNFAKIDVNINFNWTGVTAANAKLGLLAYTAGRAATASATRTKVDGKSALLFEVNDKSAYFSWDSEAVLSSSTSTVYADYKSGATIADIDCPILTCGVATTTFIANLKIANLWLNTFGWKTEMLIFSWAENKPASVYWDPAIGLTDTPSGVSSAALPSALLLASAALLAFFQH